MSSVLGRVMSLTIWGNVILKISECTIFLCEQIVEGVHANPYIHSFTDNCYQWMHLRRTLSRAYRVKIYDHHFS